MTDLFVSYFLDGSVKTGESFAVRKDIYSAPEPVAKVLQRMRHAVVVGERSRRATYVTAGFAIDEHFSVSVPYTRSVDQEGKDTSRAGVAPDIALDAASALRRAHLEALRRLKGKSTDAEIEAERAQVISALEKSLCLVRMYPW